MDFIFESRMRLKSELTHVLQTLDYVTEGQEVIAFLMFEDVSGGEIMHFFTSI